MLPKCYAEGREARFDGKRRTRINNPYAPGTKESEQWYEGWEDGDKELRVTHGAGWAIADAPEPRLESNEVRPAVVVTCRPRIDVPH